MPPPADESTIAVVGSGNLGLVWFTGHDHRLTVEELEELHPGLVAAVAAHPGVGLLLVRSTSPRGGRLRPKGTRFLDQDRVEGEDPTTLFGPHTIMSLKREDAMTHAPDLLLLSQYDPELGEVAAFEELIGSHGGLGGPQTEPFILHPVEWKLDEEVPLGRRRSTGTSAAGWTRSGSSWASQGRRRTSRQSPRPSQQPSHRSCPVSPDPAEEHDVRPNGTPPPARRAPARRLRPARPSRRARPARPAPAWRTRAPVAG